MYKVSIFDLRDPTDFLLSIALAVFLHSLFELEPQTREVFGVKRSLFGSKNHDVAVLHVTKMLLFLDTVLTMEGEPDALFALLKDVGRRHRTYGVKANFVPLMGKALILALKETYGTQFTVAHEDAWEQVLKILNGNIIKGMATES